MYDEQGSLLFQDPNLCIGFAPNQTFCLFRFVSRHNNGCLKIVFKMTSASTPISINIIDDINGSLHSNIHASSVGVVLKCCYACITYTV